MRVLLTNALSYTGPGTLEVISKSANTIYCHDPAFGNPAMAAEFQSANPELVVLNMQTPDGIFDYFDQSGISLNAVIHNDVLGNKPAPIELVPESDFVESFNQLYLFPVKLTQLLLPMFKKQKHGSFVFVTSARYLKPEPGFSVATSIRSATTSFALALAVEAASHNIQVNVVAPNYLYSEAYYPAAKYIDDEVGRKIIKSQVPLGRLGQPEEIGELISFLISGKSSFVTGQVFDFTGGWPNYSMHDLT